MVKILLFIVYVILHLYVLYLGISGTRFLVNRRSRVPQDKPLIETKPANLEILISLYFKQNEEVPYFLSFFFIFLRACVAIVALFYFYQTCVGTVTVEPYIAINAVSLLLALDSALVAWFLAIMWLDWLYGIFILFFNLVVMGCVELAEQRWVFMFKHIFACWVDPSLVGRVDAAIVPLVYNTIGASTMYIVTLNLFLIICIIFRKYLLLSVPKRQIVVEFVYILVALLWLVGVLGLFCWWFEEYSGWHVLLVYSLFSLGWLLVFPVWFCTDFYRKVYVALCVSLSLLLLDYYLLQTGLLSELFKFW